jgi:hypothetical protein
VWLASLWLRLRLQGNFWRNMIRRKWAFNTNHDQAMFAVERRLDSLAGAGYQNGFEGLALSERVSHPGTQDLSAATIKHA